MPGLDSLRVWLVWVLIFTLPKLTSDGVTVIEGSAAGEEPLVVRAQPPSDKMQAMHAMHAITSRKMWAGRLDAAFTVRPIPEHSPPLFHFQIQAKTL